MFARIKNKKGAELDDLRKDLLLFEEVMIEANIPEPTQDKIAFLYEYMDYAKELADYGVNLVVRLPEYPEYREVNRRLYEDGRNAGLNIPYPMDYQMEMPEEEYLSVVHLHTTVRTPQLARYMKLLAARKRFHISRLTTMQFYNYFTPDSTDTAAWMNGVRYGMTYIYRGGVIHSYRKDKALAMRSGLYGLCQEHGVDYQELLDGTKSSYLTEAQIYAVNKVNLLAWHKFAEGE